MGGTASQSQPSQQADKVIDARPSRPFRIAKEKRQGLDALFVSHRLCTGTRRTEQEFVLESQLVTLLFTEWAGPTFYASYNLCLP